MIDPTGMTAIEWTDRMSQLLPNILPVKIHREEEWRDWANHVCQAASISRYNPPNPAQFADWREWADRFNDTVPLN